MLRILYFCRLTFNLVRQFLGDSGSIIVARGIRAFAGVQNVVLQLGHNGITYEGTICFETNSKHY